MRYINPRITYLLTPLPAAEERELYQTQPYISVSVCLSLYVRLSVCLSHTHTHVGA